MPLAKALRLGWNEEDSVTDLDILDPYDYTDDNIQGELLVFTSSGPFIPEHEIVLVNGQIADPDTVEEITDSELDGLLIAQHLNRKATHPPLSIVSGFMYAHDNNAAWDTLPNILPHGFDKRTAKAYLQMQAISIRKIPFADVKRTVFWDPKPCPQCRANTDPTKVPVHPGCKCTVKTDTISRPDLVSDEDISNLLRSLINADVILPEAIRLGAEPITQVTIDPDTVTAFDETFRFSDFVKFVSDHEDALNNSANVISLLIDDQGDLTEQTEQGTSTIAMINDLTEGEALSTTQSKTHNLVWAIRKKV